MKTRNRIVSLTLAVCLLLGMTLYIPGPVAVHAESGCTHVHDDECGYVEGAPCEHVHDEDCGEDGEDCAHIHDDACGYIEAAPCTHAHDEACGGLAGNDNTPSLGESGAATATQITAFAELDEEIRWQGFDLGDVTLADIALPDTLEATGEDDAPLTVEGVTWACTKPDTGFDAEAVGIYTFTAVLPEGYALADGVELPEITVIVRPEGGMTIMPLSISTVQVGDYVHFGKYQGQEILWEVTGVGSNIDLKSVYVLWDNQQYHNNNTDMSLTYADSDIKAELDAFIGDINNFTAPERGQISAYGLAAGNGVAYDRSGNPATYWNGNGISNSSTPVRAYRIQTSGYGNWVSVTENHGVRPAITIDSQTEYDSPQLTGLILSDSEFDKSAGRSEPLTATVTGENARAGDVLTLELYTGQEEITPIEHTLTAADITGADFSHAFTVDAGHLQALPNGDYAVTATLSRRAGTVKTVLHTYSEGNILHIYAEGEDYIIHNQDAANTTIISMGGEDWYVIGASSNTWTLLAKGTMGTSEFDPLVNTYAGSSLQAAINGLYPGTFSAAEQSVIDDVDLTDVMPSVTGARLWPLSIWEAMNISRSLLDISGDWWLRSPGDGMDGAAYIHNDSVYAYGGSIALSRAIRPAFQLNLASVSFTSDASFGAPGAADSSLTRFSASATPQNLKLTLSNGQNDLNGFTVVNPGNSSGESGGTVPIEFTGGGTQGGEFLRVRLTQGGKIMYTGIIAANLSTSGDTVDLPLDGVEPGTYEVEIWVEQEVGSKLSNIASKSVEFQLDVRTPPPGPAPGDTLYFGSAGGAGSTYATDSAMTGQEWVVLENDGNELWLFAADVLFESGSVKQAQFHNSYDNTWSSSNLHGWLNGAYLTGAFTGWEQDAIKLHQYQTELDSNGSGFTENNQSHIFLLDLADVRTGGVAADTALLAANYHWWLRSPGSDTSRAACVFSDGDVYSGGSGVDFTLGIRPAFRLNPASIIFTSDVSGANAKSLINAGDQLVAVADLNTGEPQALTLWVNDMALSGVAVTGTSGNTLTLTYDAASAQTGNHQILSCLLLDSGGETLFYGKLEDLQTVASGAASVTLPGTLPDGSYTLQIFNEQANGDYETDYAGTPTNIPIEISGGVVVDTVAPSVVSVSPSGSGAAVDGHVVITFDEAMSTSAGSVTLTPNSGSPQALTGGSWNNPTHTVYTIPYSSLANSTTYTIGITGFTDVAGNPMNTTGPHTFTTAAQGQTAAPVASPPGGAYSTAQTVTLTSATTGAAIYYTLDGSDPTVTTNSARQTYSLPINVPLGTTLKAYATATGLTDSAVLTAVYTQDNGGGNGGGSNTYTVTYNANGGSGTPPATATVSKDSAYTIALPVGLTAPAGQRFVEWNTNSTGSGTGYMPGKTITVTGNLTLYAIWETIPQPSYTVTFDANGGSVTPTSLPTGADGRLAYLPTPTRSSYAFAGWYTQRSGGTEIDADHVFTENTTVYAHWNYTGGSGGDNGNGNSGNNNGGSGGGGGGGSSETPAPKTQLPASAFAWDGERTLTINHDSVTALGLLSVQWDGQPLTRGTDYTVHQGSVIVRFGEDFMAAQAPGAHTVRVEFLNHYGETTIKLTADTDTTDTNPNNPNTGGDTHNPQTGDFDNSPWWWLLALIPAAALTMYAAAKLWRRLRRTEG